MTENQAKQIKGLSRAEVLEKLKIEKMGTGIPLIH